MKLKNLLSIFKSNESTIENNTIELFSPLVGRCIPLDQVLDTTFASGIIGPGLAIEPTKGIVYAPFDGKVTMVFNTLHALGLTHDSGLELLIHVGLDTVTLNGKPFKAFVKVGDYIRRGDKLLKFDMNQILESGLSLSTPIIITNANQFNIDIVSKNSDVQTKDIIIEATIRKEER